MWFWIFKHHHIFFLISQNEIFSKELLFKTYDIKYTSIITIKMRLYCYLYNLNHMLKIFFFLQHLISSLLDIFNLLSIIGVRYIVSGFNS